MSVWVQNVVQGSEHFLAQLEQRGFTEDPARWEHQVQRLQRAATWNRYDVRVVMQLARFYQWRAFEQRLWPELSNPSRKRAVYFLREATRKRPSWGLAWASLSVAKVDADETDEEMVSALSRAMELGPWERQVQHQVVLAGIRAWEELPDETRRSVLNMVRRGLKDPTLSAHIMDIAIDNNWASQLKPFVVDDKNLETMFKAALARHET